MNKGGIEAKAKKPNLFGFAFNWDSGSSVARNKIGMRETRRKVPNENGNLGFFGWQDGVRLSKVKEGKRDKNEGSRGVVKEIDFSKAEIDSIELRIFRFFCCGCSVSIGEDSALSEIKRL